MTFRSRLSRAQPRSCSHAVSRASWLMLVTSPAVISLISASISCAAASAILRAASAKARSTQKPRLLMTVLRAQGLLGLRQRRQSVIELALYLNILPAIVVKAIKPLLILKPVDVGGVLVLVWPPRLRCLVHQPFAGGILSIAEL